MFIEYFWVSDIIRKYFVSESPEQTDVRVF